MKEDKVVRLGRIADDKLESKYRKYVAIDRDCGAAFSRARGRKATTGTRRLVTKLRETKKEIAALWKTVLRDAKIVGATCTKAYLTGELGQFDLVLVDEASMVPGRRYGSRLVLASERVVISGDFVRYHLL